MVYFIWGLTQTETPNNGTIVELRINGTVADSDWTIGSSFWSSWFKVFKESIILFTFVETLLLSTKL